ncbi:helix-turn-helix transcriptional regulator [Sphingomonas sp. dw_22]|uniref:helix-turn-helix domain-containing protein n=1 Tax=Sphingomonas sp. dw_22 TaxID=2721175 RepID=UPI0021161A81|nr:helix-turn-helix transcriptional regulator [Sphingomonas sp. dw_22]
MIRGDRVAARISELGTSQAAVARALGISQQAVGKIVKGETHNTAHLVRLARTLQTTPEYLLGETDDPTPGKGFYAPRVEAPAMQFVSMQVALPAEDALTRMFEDLLRPLDRNMPLADLARALARRLPAGLVQLRDSMGSEDNAQPRVAD